MAGTLPLETFGSLASKKKKKLVSANKILVYGLQHSSEKAEFGKKKKMKQQLKIVTHLPWNVNKLFLENMGLTII